MVSPRLFARRAIRDLDALRVVAVASDRSTVLDFSACGSRILIFFWEIANVSKITMYLDEMLNPRMTQCEVH